MTSTELTTYQAPSAGGSLSAFSDINAFESAQRIANALAASDLVPQSYKKNVANCLVALEVSQRCRASVLMVMQNLNMIHGRPSWSSTYIIAALNSCGRFAPVRFKMDGDGDSRSCVAWTTDKSGEVLEGPPVSITMAKLEGWFDKSGSKWKTMPELMLRYRAAAFFGRLYAPDILMGMRTDDEEREIIDVTPDRIDEPTAGPAPAEAAKKLNARIRKAKPPEEPTVLEEDTSSVPQTDPPHSTPPSEEQHF